MIQAAAVDPPTQSAAAACFLKWAGGKRQLLPEIGKHISADFAGRYFEPFLGGGAVFFDLMTTMAPRSYLGDVNAELIATYTAVRDDVEGVISALHAHAREHSEKNYYAVRAQRMRSGASVAARMIYLNRTCFNGLYRVNKAGRFNVPVGKYTNPTICDAENLRACSRVLRDAELVCADFASVLAVAKSGDLVYLDPPYVPASETGDFTKFTAAGFGPADQERLVGVARRLKETGVQVLLSNADLPAVRVLYAGFEMRAVKARRNINSKGGKRGAVGELLIW
jgi:DNA adenine methylase